MSATATALTIRAGMATATVIGGSAAATSAATIILASAGGAAVVAIAYGVYKKLSS